MSDSLLPAAVAAKVMAEVSLLPPQAVEVLLIVVKSLPQAVATGYGAIHIEFRDYSATVEVTSSTKIGKKA